MTETARKIVWLKGKSLADRRCDTDGCGETAVCYLGTDQRSTVFMCKACVMKAAA